MENGELIATEVLPKFAKGLREAAREGGALEAGTKTINAAQNRMATAFTASIEAMMEGGGKEGLVDIFNTIADVVKDLMPLFKGLGAILKGVGYIFKYVIGPIFKVLTPLLNILGGIVSGLMDAIDMVFGLGDAANKSWKDLSELEKVLRAIGNALEDIAKPFRSISGMLGATDATIKAEGNYATGAAKVATPFGAVSHMLGGDFLDKTKASLGKTLGGGATASKSVATTTTIGSITFSPTINGNNSAQMSQDLDKWWDTKLKSIATSPP